MYNKVWLAFVDIKAKNGRRFNDLVELEKNNNPAEYIGAWANLLLISTTINEVPNIIEAGLNELDMTVKFIDRIQNVNSLIEYDEIDENVVKEADWLLSSGFVFKISDKLFPYTE